MKKNIRSSRRNNAEARHWFLYKQIVAVSIFISTLMYLVGPGNFGTMVLTPLGTVFYFIVPLATLTSAVAMFAVGTKGLHEFLEKLNMQDKYYGKGDYSTKLEDGVIDSYGNEIS